MPPNSTFCTSRVLIARFSGNPLRFLVSVIFFVTVFAPVFQHSSALMDYQYSAFCVCVLSFLISSNALANGKVHKNVPSHAKLQSNNTNQSSNRAVQNKTKNSSKPQMNLDYFLANDGLDTNYPFSEIERFFQKHPEHKIFFKPAPPQIGNRGGWTNDDSENLCKIRRNPAFAPQALDNTLGVKKTIINQDDLKQQIPTETCMSPNRSDYRCSNIRLGYESICKQNYMSVKLATFNSTVGVAYDTFIVPSCCACVLVEAP